MDTFSIVAGLASILSLIFSFTAAIQATSASKAATAARDAALVRTLADELQIACLRAEQIVDFLKHDRFSEATLRADELISNLSELPYRRGPFLTNKHLDSILTSSQQLQSITEAIFPTSKGQPENLDVRQILVVAWRVVTVLREILGNVRSNIEIGGSQ